ncbi:MAG: hypothetical protein L0Y72_18240 [Gemmataceae bacterium]|nr:hypothetical protein [Gemmataceae bacterium]MCI0740991.1 hypothetical protein [Gemmataceae bacterium]
MPQQMLLKPGYGSFVTYANKLDRAGHNDASLDLIYDSVDELLRASQFEECNEILKGIEVESCSIDVLLAILTATAPARSQLKSRDQFFQLVKSFVERRGLQEPGLLDGLEG